MNFDRPIVLTLLLAVVPLGLWISARFKRRLPAFLDLVGRRDEGVFERELASRGSLAAALFLTAFASAVISLSGPRWGERLVPEYRRGLDVVLALDVSRSMDAKDVSPSRLRRAASVARQFAEKETGLRFAVALGKGAGVLSVPLTDDAESVLGLLRTMSSESLSSGGTDLERLLDAARSAFPESSSARKLIVLFSDGEGLSGNSKEAVTRAADAGVKIASVGVGTEAGIDLPIKDATGTPVRSRLRPAALRFAAERTGGVYVDGNRSDAASSLASFAAKTSAVSAADGFRREPIPRYRLFAFLALACFLASRIAETVPRRRR